MSWRSIAILALIGLADLALLAWFWVKDTYTRIDEDRP